MTLYNRWRGFQPWPGAWTMLEGKKLAVHRMLPTEVRGAQARMPGELLVEQGTMFAACGDGTWLELVEVQPEGKRKMTAGEFLRGHNLQSGTWSGDEQRSENAATTNHKKEKGPFGGRFAELVQMTRSPRLGGFRIKSCYR